MAARSGGNDGLDRPGERPRHDRGAFPEALAACHCRFEQIHPFLDGNGRAGRLILNLVLIRLGYPPVIVYKRDRERYLQALRRADAGESSPLGEMLARAVLNSLHGSSFRPWPVPPDSCRWPPWKPPASRRRHCARRRNGAVSGPLEVRTASGGAPAAGSTSTWRAVTGAANRAHDGVRLPAPGRPRRALTRCAARPRCRDAPPAGPAGRRRGRRPRAARSGRRPASPRHGGRCRRAGSREAASAARRRQNR